ncbi:uncharacterized protein LOC117330544 isoform X2 [Pecten maximus]|uniref:uncharacterized protein LOC117330544 isoform X2 n=1 Tax=Pecten maximus TaxID=6579 RepID=UPI001457F8DA|nr:uncharacterized protein LOC117330544 isoform X2 [Pecten maximus]
MLTLKLSTTFVLLYVSVRVKLQTYDNEYYCPTSDDVVISDSPECEQQNCSQKRRSAEDSYFNCSIGMFKEWEKFKEKFRVSESYEKKSDETLNPPTVSAVGFYMIADRNNVKNNPNLNLTFRLPRHSAYDTKALLIKFIGMNDKRYPELIDPYYKDSPRYRLFSFQSYKSSELDTKYPREIVYGCLMGLDCTSAKRVYLITFTAYTMNSQHPGSSLTYQFTVYTTRYFTKSSKVTIAVAYMHRLRKMHVVFEPISEDHASRYTYYDIQLMEIDTGKLQTVQMEHGSVGYEYEFNNVTNGKYVVEVRVRNCSGIEPCPQSQSGIVEVDYTTVEGPRLKDDLAFQKTMSPSSGIYATIGAVGGVALLLLLLACFVISVDHRPKVCILNLCSEDIHTNVSTALQQCLKQYFHTTVTAEDIGLSTKEVYSKFGLQKLDKIIIATMCHHVKIEKIENLYIRWKNKGCTKNLFICFSQTERNMMSQSDKWFHWYHDSKKMIEYIKEKDNGHCLNRFKRSRPPLNNISENSGEFHNFQRVLQTFREPTDTPPMDPCPVRSNREEDIHRPLLHSRHCYPNIPEPFIDENFFLHFPKTTALPENSYDCNPSNSSDIPLSDCPAMENDLNQSVIDCPQKVFTPVKNDIDMDKFSNRMLLISMEM